jgi:hypothetical protein
LWDLFYEWKWKWQKKYEEEKKIWFEEDKLEFFTCNDLPKVQFQYPIKTRFHILLSSHIKCIFIRQKTEKISNLVTFIRFFFSFRFLFSNIFVCRCRIRDEKEKGAKLHNNNDDEHYPDATDKRHSLKIFSKLFLFRSLFLSQ